MSQFSSSNAKPEERALNDAQTLHQAFTQTAEMALERELRAMIVDLRDVAREELLPLFTLRGKVPVVDKFVDGLWEPVTEAGIRTSEKLLQRVQQRLPGSFTEEHLPAKYADRIKHDLLWMIDGDDGTQESTIGFNKGVAMHAALLARRSDDVYLPRLGVIYLPSTDTLWYSDPVGDVHFERGGEPQKLPHVSRGKVLRVYDRKVDPDDRLVAGYRELGTHLGMQVEVPESGGAGASFSDLLEGKLDLIVLTRANSKQWDLAMVAPMIQSRGGFLCDIRGNEFTNYNREDYVNREGYIASLTLSKEEVLPFFSHDLVRRESSRR